MAKTKDSSKRETSERRRHGAPILGVEEFAHRKGVTKAIQGFRKRKEKKRVETSKALRYYEKVMKQEGFEPGKGASRKRQEKEGSVAHGRTEEKEEKSTTSNSTQNRRKKRMNPFQKTLQKADEKKKQVQKAQEEREGREKERQEKLRQRRSRTKLLTQRTRKGQPIMKNVVEDILNRLQRDDSK